MAGHQSIQIIGHLGADPEMRYTPAGKPVTNFSVAVNEPYTDKEGEKHDVTTWFRVTAWGNLAEVCQKFLEKSHKVFVEGKLVADPETGGPRIWGEDEAQANFEIKASKVVFLESKSKDRKSTPYDEEEDEAPRKAKPKVKPKVKAKASYIEDDE